MNLREAAASMSAKQVRAVLASLFSALHPEPDYRALMPELLIRGGHDKLGNFAKVMPLWQQRDPQASYQVIRDAGHVANPGQSLPVQRTASPVSRGGHPRRGLDDEIGRVRVAENLYLSKTKIRMAKRIVFTTFGSLGDLHPYIALALELERRGYQVAIATNWYLREHIEDAGVPFLHVRPDLSGTDAALIRRILDPIHGPKHLLKYLFASIRDSFQDLSQAVKQADLLITHPATFAGPPVAKLTGMPWVSTVLSPLSFLSLSDPPVIPQMPSLDLRRVPRLLSRSIIALGKRLVRGWSEPLRRFYREIGVPLDLDPVFEGQHSPYGVLGLFSNILAHPQPDWPRNSIITGFAFYDGNALSCPALAELEEFIGTGEPPLVFTLGSAAQLNAGNFYKSSATAAKMLGERAILLGATIAEDSMIAPSSNLFAAGYVPYSKILPFAKAVVHSGGIGTTGQALRAGRPMVVVPFSHDQPDNAARLRSLGISETIPIRKYDAPKARSALTKILGDRRYALNALEASHRLKSEDGVKNACDAIVQVFEEHLS